MAIRSFQSPEERVAYQRIAALLKASRIAESEIVAHLGLYLDRSALGHILFMDEMYRRILGVHGAVIELGVRWGRNLALLTELRNLHEPRNASRRIVGFDTFEGFPKVTPQDGTADGVGLGAYSVAKGYESELASLLSAHERFGLRSHIQKFELVKGDVVQTVPDYFRLHPHTIVAMAYFDLDLYEGTRASLLAVADRLVKGSVVIFDQLGMEELPGETVALLDTWGLRRAKLQRSDMSQFESFMVME